MQYSCHFKYNLGPEKAFEVLGTEEDFSDSCLEDHSLLVDALLIKRGINNDTSNNLLNVGGASSRSLSQTKRREEKAFLRHFLFKWKPQPLITLMNIYCPFSLLFALSHVYARTHTHTHASSRRQTDRKREEWVGHLQVTHHVIFLSLSSSLSLIFFSWRCLLFHLTTDEACQG